MSIDPLGINNRQLGQFGSGYWDAKVGPIPHSYPATPKQKLEELRGFFKSRYGSYEIVTRSLIECNGANFFIPFDGRLNFVNKNHKDLFFQELQKLDGNNNLYGRCRYFYRQSDNCLLKCWLNQHTPQTPAVMEEEKLIATLFLQTMPKNIIIFPYIDQDFSKWPDEEKIRFYVFLKNAGGENAVKSFDKFTAEAARRSENSFMKWASARLDTVSESVNKVNLPERLFQKLDELVLLQIFNIKTDDARRRCLYAYGCFIGMRNAVNPLSLLAGLTSFHKLGELWDKLVSFFKMQGSADDFALTLGQLMGAALGAPLGVRLIKLTMPKAMSALKGAVKKLGSGFQKLDAALDETFNAPKKPASAPKPAKTREEGRLQSLERRENSRKKKLTRAKNNRKIEIQKQTKETPEAKNINVSPLLSYSEHYRIGKTFFEQFVSQKNRSHILHKKALYHLEQSEKANPPAEVSFENNWRLCVLKIHSHSWKDAISHFIKALDKHRAIQSEHYRLVSAHNGDNIEKNNHIRPAFNVKDKKSELYISQEKYRSKIIYDVYTKLQKKLNAEIDKFNKINLETEVRVMDLGKKCTGVANQIKKIEKELQAMDYKIKALRRTNFEIRGPSEILRKSLELSDLEKSQAAKSAELPILKGRLDKLNKDFFKTCRKNANAKKKLVNLKKEYIRSFRLRMIWHGIPLWILNN